jgi:hypothetical protein
LAIASDAVKKLSVRAACQAALQELKRSAEWFEQCDCDKRRQARDAAKRIDREDADRVHLQLEPDSDDDWA